MSIIRARNLVLCHIRGFAVRGSSSSLSHTPLAYNQSVLDGVPGPLMDTLPAILPHDATVITAALGTTTAIARPMFWANAMLSHHSPRTTSRSATLLEGGSTSTIKQSFNSTETTAPNDDYEEIQITWPDTASHSYAREATPKAKTSYADILAQSKYNT
ncbi:hypothetical protein N7444_011537 [Penicillium canescens]|nr:hypothetical protein N7444_011537 [Penicillium canescens]